MDSYAQADPILKAVCFHWLSKLEHARNLKKRVFQDDADECMGFYNGPRNWNELMGGHVGLTSAEILPDPTFKMSVNKAFELVTIFGPALFYQNPVRTVTPRAPLAVPLNIFPDPYLAQAVYQEQAQQLERDGFRATLIEAYLNWTPIDGGLVGESRAAITEALIKGRGCVWTELHAPPGTTFRVVRSTHDSVDNLLIDPDADSFEHAVWVARRCIHPVWQVERDYGLKPGTLKGNMESQAVQAEIAADSARQYDRKRGLTNDLLTYWKIYSKMGIGGRLQGLNRSYRGPLEVFGDHCYLVIAKDVPFPLNLPPAAQQLPAPGPWGLNDEVRLRTGWPTPFWAHGGWPVVPLDFHPVENSAWPMSHLRSALGEVKFLNWAFSFLAGKVRNTCRDFIAIKKEAGEEIKTAILEGRDLTLLELEADHKTIAELVSFLQHPEVNGDIWKVIQAVEDNFDKRTGLTELMYGEEGSRQIRSAAEVEVRKSNMSVRPDDMSRQVEDWMSLVARNEAVCARYHLRDPDIRPVLGDLAAPLWMQFVASREMGDVGRQLDYRIEAGSTRKPNKETQQARMAESVQLLLPVFQQYAAMSGDLMPLNNLIADWARSRDLNPARYQLQAAPPAAAPQGGEGDQFGAPPPAGGPPGEPPAQQAQP